MDSNIQAPKRSIKLEVSDDDGEFPQQLESLLDKYIDPNDFTSSIDDMLGNASLLNFLCDNSQLDLTRLKVESGEIDEERELNPSATLNEASTSKECGQMFPGCANHQLAGVCELDYQPPSIDVSNGHCNLGKGGNSIGKHPKSNIRTDMIIDLTSDTEGSRTNSPQIGIKQRKRRAANRATARTFNKKRKVIIDSNGKKQIKRERGENATIKGGNYEPSNRNTVPEAHPQSADLCSEQRRKTISLYRRKENNSSEAMKLRLVRVQINDRNGDQFEDKSNQITIDTSASNWTPTDFDQNNLRFDNGQKQCDNEQSTDTLTDAIHSPSQNPTDKVSSQTFADLETIISPEVQSVVPNELPDADAEPKSLLITANTLEAANISMGMQSFCNSNESIRGLESFLDRHIDPNQVTFSIEAMFGNGSLLDAELDDSRHDSTRVRVDDEVETETETNPSDAVNEAPPSDVHEQISFCCAELSLVDIPELDEVATSVIALDGNRNIAQNAESTEEQINSNERSPELAIDATPDNEEANQRANNLLKNTNATPKRRRANQQKRKITIRANATSLNMKQNLVAESKGAKKLKCDFCSYSSSDSSNFKKHTRIHTDEKLFKCEVCAMGFTRKDALRSHMRTHADQFSFKCSNCRQGFSVEKKWKIHEKSCNRRRYDCYLCEYTCSLKSNLVNHMRIHTGELPFECKVCAMGFTQKVNLKSHMRTHADQFRFHCSICRQGFSVKQKWKLHEKNCNPKRYECFLCQYTSLRKSSLVAHMRIHTGVKPFQCSECPERFTQKAHLNIHTKRCH